MFGVKSCNEKISTWFLKKCQKFLPKRKKGWWGKSLSEKSKSTQKASRLSSSNKNRVSGDIAVFDPYYYTFMVIAACRRAAPNTAKRN